ncbi:MAG: hypothetical protein GY797_23920 [Deltaproteobacteria bacterium]|nr:hypothetical protein [Deltaproteobacteria bacterium]
MNYQTSSHDGSHITNFYDFFEWWYFDFDLKNDYHIYIVWHSPLFCLKEFYSTLLVRIYSPDTVGSARAIANTKCMRIFRYHQSNVVQSESKCDISFPSGYIKEVEGNYVIKIDEKDFYIDLKLERLLPPISVKDNLIYQTKNGEKYFKWYIPLPRAATRGEIKIDGNHMEAEGILYHDHNWGNLNLKKYIRDWVWGRVFFKDFTVIFGDVHANDPEKKFQILLFVDRNGNCIDTSSFKINYRQFDNQRQYKIQTPNWFSVEFENRGKYRIDFRQKRELVIEEAPFGSFDNNFFNVWLAKLYYFFKLYYGSNFFKKWYGRLIYFQSEIIGELYKNNHIEDKQSGRIEVMSFVD